MNCSNVNFQMNRRDFFGRFGFGLGGAALFGMFNRDLGAASAAAANPFKGVTVTPANNRRLRLGGVCAAAKFAVRSVAVPSNNHELNIFIVVSFFRTA